MGKGGKYRENNEMKIAQYAIKRREVFGALLIFPPFFNPVYNTSEEIKRYPYEVNYSKRRQCGRNNTV